MPLAVVAIPFPDEVLARVWQISWQAGAIAILVLFLQMFLGRWITARWKHALWTLVLLRLLMPALPSSSFSIFSLSAFIPQSKISTARSVDPLRQINVTYSNGPVAPESFAPRLPILSAPVPAAAAPTVPWSEMVLVCWLAVAAIVCCWRVVTDRRFFRRLRMGSTRGTERLTSLLERARLKVKLYRLPSIVQTSMVGAPAVTGILKPCILFPTDLADRLTDGQLMLIILHELTHIACFDVAMDWLWAILQSLHWFNPVLWIANSIRQSDREIARDAMVLSLAGQSQAPQYGGLLIDLTQPLPVSIFCPSLIGMLGGKRRLRRRIKMISQYRRSSWLSASAGACVLIIAGCCTLSGPSKPANSSAIPPTAPLGKKPEASTSLTTRITLSYNDPLQSEPPATPGELAVQVKLDQKIVGEIRYDAEPLEKVLHDLAAKSGLHFYVDWPALQKAGVVRTSPVTARLREMKYFEAIELVFKTVEGGESPDQLGYAADEGVLTISTYRELDKNTVTRRYDVNDLLFEAPDYGSVPNLVHPELSAPGATGAAEAAAQTWANRVDELRKYVLENVEPGSWKEHGGITGSIASSPLRAVLLITQTPRAQRKVQAVLDGLRQSRALQVSIETRIFSLPESAEAMLPDHLQGRLALVRNAGRFRCDQFVTDEDVHQLVQVASASPAASSLTAPRLTLFSGQTAVLVVQSQQAYVGDMKKVLASTTQPLHYEPITQSTTATGVTVKITTCISPDGKTVFVDLDDQVARLLDLLPEQYGRNASAGKIQRPVFATFKRKAACAIADSSTLLLGGVNQIDAGDAKFNADSPDKSANEAKVQTIRSEHASHEYLLIKAKILRPR